MLETQSGGASDGYTQYNTSNVIVIPKKVWLTSARQESVLHVEFINTVKPVYNDHLMGYFSAFW